MSTLFEYEIRVPGVVPQAVLIEIEGVQVAVEPVQTVLRGSVVGSGGAARDHQPVGKGRPGPSSGAAGDGRFRHRARLPQSAGRAEASLMARDVYEFHVAGRIGVVSRFALPELTVGIEPACTVLTGCADDPAEIDDLLRRLAERGLIAREVLFSREHQW